MSKIAVAGGGAAGMMAAVFAARNGNEVYLYEKNEKLGKKLFITGKGRCNLTNAADIEELFAAVVSNPKFLYSSFYSFTNDQTIAFFEELGVKTKVERGGRVFPASDHSSDIIRGLEKELNRLGVHVELNTEVKQLRTENGRVKGLLLASGREIEADAVIVAAGGLSYPSTGSTGDGYRLAESCGHRITPLSPALVPMEVKEWYAKELMGLSLRNIEITITDGTKKLFQDFGEMLFTHFGVSGPVVLSASSYAAKIIRKTPLKMDIDLKPALSKEQLDARILRDFDEAKNKQFKNALNHLFPAKLIPVMIKRSGIDPEKQVNEVTAEERKRLVDLTKAFTVTLTGLRGYNEAIVTQGGVNVKEVNPSTMESKKLKGLYFAGEVLDLDGVTGGFNLQIAWSTGMLAGRSAE